jgi:3-phenylpropionate/cinnamic acid dioxygenase small subunit
MSVLEDKDAIREVLHLYCHYMDEGKFEALGALFADDGVWIAPYRTATTPSGIAAWLTQSVPPEPRRMHYVMNSVIRVEGDRAEAKSNYMTVFAGDNGPVPSVCGTYVDRLARERGVWKFQRRELVHSFKGEMMLNLPPNSR